MTQYAPISVRQGETVALPVPLMREGYSFICWYDVKIGLEWTSEMPVTQDITLAIRYSAPTETLNVLFVLNGGRFPGDDGSIQGYAIATNSDSIIVEPPEDPVRDGYRFMGWATEDGTLWTNYSTPITESLTLYAVWQSLATYTVTFDVGTSAISAPQPQTVHGGETVDAPEEPLLDGYRFMGWYVDEQTLWDFSEPVTEDMTLFAAWDYDRFCFSNSTSAFGTGRTYEVTGKYLEALKSGLSSAAWALVNREMMSQWGGSCFGMSAVYTLRYAGELHPGAFQAGADVLYDLAKPTESETTANLINYYHLQQLRPESSGEEPDRNNAYYYIPEWAIDGTYARYLVEELEQTKQPVLICFLFGRTNTAADLWDTTNLEKYGHAVVSLNCRKNADDSYQIDIWDPNSSQTDVLTISANYRSVNFQSGVYPNAKIKGSLPVAASDATYNHINIEEYIGGRSTSSAADTGSLILQDVTLDDFRLTAADGSYAVFENGSYVSGTMEPAIGMAAAGDGGSMSYAFPYSTSYELSTSADAAGTVDLLMGAYYVSVESDGLKSLEVTDDGQISVSSGKAAAQTLSVTSDALGGDWNSITVSGTDTGLTVDVGNEAVTVSSDNPISATVTGSNVFTEKTSTARTVSVTSAGVTVSTASGGLTEADTAGENPFTDVPKEAYYEQAVLWAVEQGITNGTGPATFSPDVTCSRGQIVTFLWRAQGAPEPGSAGGFTDVPSGAYYAQAVAWAVASGVTNGSGDGTFSPEADCTRAQIVTFLWRCMGQ